MVNYSLTVENGELKFNNINVRNTTHGPNYIPFNDSNTISLDNIIKDQEHINFLDCIKDGTNEITIVNLDLFTYNDQSPLTSGFKESLDSYESYTKPSKPFLEPHSWSNFR